MERFAYIFALICLFAACTKETVTNNVPIPNPVIKSQDTATPVQGTINGGGGKGVRCNQNGRIVIRTLDLYEANVLYGLEQINVPDAQDPALDIFTALLTRHLWNPDTIPMDEYKARFRELLTGNFLKKMRFIGSTQKLKLINDSYEPVLEDGCEVVQVAAYYDESILLVDKSLWDQMDWVNKIALLAHELIYYTDRQNGSTNSMAARKLVGLLFSTKGARPKADGVPSERSQYSRCAVFFKDANVGYFYAYKSAKDGREGTEFVFNYLKNNYSLYRTSAFLNGTAFSSIFEPDHKGSAESDLFVDTYPEKQSLKFSFSGSGKGSMLLLDKATGTVSDSYSISCDGTRAN